MGSRKLVLLQRGAAAMHGESFFFFFFFFFFFAVPLQNSAHGKKARSFARKCELLFVDGVFPFPEVHHSLFISSGTIVLYSMLCASKTNA